MYRSKLTIFDMGYNGNFKQLTDKDLAIVLGAVIKSAPTRDLSVITLHRNEIVNRTMHELGVAPGRESEAHWLHDDLHRVFDALMMHLNAGSISIINLGQFQPNYSQKWNTKIRPKL